MINTRHGPRLLRQAARSWAGQTSRVMVRARRLNVDWICADALTCEIPPVDLVYIDPPYENTSGYRGITSAEPGAFWRRAAQVAVRGAPVYMSEAAGPPDDVQATLVHRHPLGRRHMHRGPGERVELLWRVSRT